MMRRTGWVVLVVGLVVGTAVALGLGTWQMTEKNRPAPTLVADQTAARDEVVELTTANLEKLLSYTPRTDDDDVDNLAALLTGEAVDNYREQMRSKTAIARSNGVTQTSNVRNAAIETLSADKAQVLTFVDQIVESTGNKTRTEAQLAIRVELAQINGAWLITAINTL
ncbi:hypothetical protein AFM11_13295 [Mycolicibacterium wolinskyi]|uniref:Mce-associated membrane protein n=1 Tax=Mycolicibacterium wolinskyi TaxID=59750 RepID=A0A132PN35_9MYCO|nr:hypothetical protein AFM11_13295 [Mycolicibacterium wolinskyi]